MSSPLLRALVVEDDPAWQQILTELLRDAGLEVDTADTAESAIAALRLAAHRLAVVDLSLSASGPQDTQGLSVLDAVRRYDPGCATMLLSGFATVELAVSAMTQHGASTCLRKETFSRAEFREWVGRALASAPSWTPPVAEARPGLGGGGPAERQRTGLVLVVEDDAGWRSILSELLTDAGYRVKTSSGFGEALGALRRERIALAVVDLSLDGPWPGADTARPSAPAGDQRDGHQLLATIRAGHVPAIVVSGISTPAEIERVYSEFGVFAFVEKRTFVRQAFLKLVEEAITGAGSGAELAHLTEREREVLALLAQGLTNKEIAEALVITANTVKRHLKAIFAKLDVHTRSAAAARAISAGVTVQRHARNPPADS